MKKYLVMTGGASYIIKADSIDMADSGVIKLSKKENGTYVIIAALPHGASVIQEDVIVKPEAPSIVKPMLAN